MNDMPNDMLKSYAQTVRASTATVLESLAIVRRHLPQIADDYGRKAATDMAGLIVMQLEEQVKLADLAIENAGNEKAP